MKKLVFCIPALANSGGMERVLSRKANYLVNLGYDIHIITSDQMGRPVFFPLDERIHLHDLGIDHEANNHTSLARKLMDYPVKIVRHRHRLKNLLLSLKADIVISMFGLEASFLPHIKDGSRKVLEYHFSKNKRLHYHRKGLWRAVDEWRTKKDEQTVRLYDDFVVLTEEDRALWGNVPNIHVIANPLPFETESYADTSSKRIVAAGRYNYQKNFEALIDIWAQIEPSYPDWRLSIYGDGEERDNLQRKIDEYALSRISLERPTKEMLQVYLSSSAYVMTSHYEGLPMVLLEAQACGLPIVSYACECGPRDVVEHGKTGFLVSMYDQAQFVNSLRELMDNAPLRHEMGQQAKAASKRYSLEAIMDRWVTLFERNAPKS